MLAATVATLACAVLSGVEPAELQDASSVDDIVVMEPTSPAEELVRQVRRLSTNSTGDGISTGSLVAIIVGSAAAIVLVLGALWYFACRAKPMYGGKPTAGYAPMPNLKLALKAAARPPSAYTAGGTLKIGYLSGLPAGHVTYDLVGSMLSFHSDGGGPFA